MKPIIKAYLQLIRVDHWIKSSLFLMGVVVVPFIASSYVFSLASILCGLLVLFAASSANYVLNGILDAPYDLLHPQKSLRPIPSGAISRQKALLVYIALVVLSAWGAWAIGVDFAVVAGLFLLNGFLYNVRPFRLKDHQYLDAIDEALGFPLRFLLGWLSVSPVASLPILGLLAMWLAGIFFMFCKRLAEINAWKGNGTLAQFRPSLSLYTRNGLYRLCVLSGCATVLASGFFFLWHNFSLIPLFFLTYVLFEFLNISLADESAAQAPQLLFKEKRLMVACAALVASFLLTNVL